MEYLKNKFEVASRGTLLMSKVKFRARSQTWTKNLSEYDNIFAHSGNRLQVLTFTQG